MIALCAEAVELADQIAQQGGMLDAPTTQAWTRRLKCLPRERRGDVSTHLALLSLRLARSGCAAARTLATLVVVARGHDLADGELMEMSDRRRRASLQLIGGIR